MILKKYHFIIEKDGSVGEIMFMNVSGEDTTAILSNVGDDDGNNNPAMPGFLIDVLNGGCKTHQHTLLNSIALLVKNSLRIAYLLMVMASLATQSLEIFSV